MERTAGRPEVVIGLIDGPVALGHSDLAAAKIRALPGREGVGCTRPDGLACRHGTFIAGVLMARRGSAAPALCPGCTMLVWPLFSDATAGGPWVPSATPEDLAGAMLESMAAGARVLNLSVGLASISARSEGVLGEALDEAARRGVLVVAAAGNQGTVTSSALTRHPWIIPVVACDDRGRPTGESNLGPSIGRRGVRAPGDAVTSLGTAGPAVSNGGTSVAVPFVTGTIALLWSVFPRASAVEMRRAVAGVSGARPRSIVPPLLDARTAFEILRQTRPGEG